MTDNSEATETDLLAGDVDRRGFLNCMAWAGTGLLWTMSGGVPKSGPLGARKPGKNDLFFVQISDSHIGFNKAANADVTATMQAAITKINALPVAPAFLLHTGDNSQLAIVRRECYGGRQKRVDTVAFDEVPQLQLVDQAALPDTEAGRTMLQGRIREAVAALPDVLRETLILRELQYCSYGEIATITEVPLGTVMSRLSRARARLAESLGSLVTIEEEYG